MLYPKFTQRYLAAIVFSLIVALGVSTLFLVYSLYLRRSPLLVESLKRSENVVPTVYNGKSKENPSIKAKFPGRIERVDEPINFEAISYKKGSDNSIHNDTHLNRSDVITWESKTNYTDLDDSSYSDTIYIDDFEKNRTNFFKIEKPELRYESKPDRSYADFEVTSNTRLRKYEKLPPYDMEATEAHQSNLDTLYDRNRDSNERFEIAEDDVDADDIDDIDDASIYGSGSGDFGDKQFDYDISTIRDFTKDWTKHGRRIHYDYQKKREYLQTKNNSKTKKTKLLKANGKEKRRRGRKLNRSGGKTSTNYRFSIDADDANSDNEEREFPKLLKSESTPSSDMESHFVMGKERAKLNQNGKSNKRLKNKDIITTKTTKTTKYTTTTQKLGTSQHSSDQKITKPSLRYSERDNEIRASTQMDNRNNEAAARDSQVKPATWVETRTRRILGNVRKSEERSRQLLLCEEAGGGELCRMLFKGHTSE